MNSQDGVKNARDRLIIALDVPTAAEAVDLSQTLSGDISFFKIGLQLYTAEGPAIVHRVRSTGANVFLDLKLFDIPNTVGKAGRGRSWPRHLDVDYSPRRRPTNDRSRCCGMSAGTLAPRRHRAHEL
jgi:orotidine-5'-phosphate decarboxylase